MLSKEKSNTRPVSKCAQFRNSYANDTVIADGTFLTGAPTLTVQGVRVFKVIEQSSDGDNNVADCLELLGNWLICSFGSETTTIYRPSSVLLGCLIISSVYFVLTSRLV
jgi:hypothetical protein